MATGAALLDTTKYVRVNAALNPLILQSHRDSVRIAFSSVQPSKDNAAFHTLSGGDPIYSVPSLDVDVWALGMTETSSLTVTEFGLGDNPIDTIEELALMLKQHLSAIWIDQTAVICELQLMNARIEEAFDTRIKAADV